MRLTSSTFVIGISALILGAGVIARAVALSEAGPLDVTTGNGPSHAIFGTSTSSTRADGVIGNATDGYGVWGATKSATFAGVFGTSSTTGIGVLGDSSGIAVEGKSSSNTAPAILGKNFGSGTGIEASAPNLALRAKSTNNYVAIEATSGSGTGVMASGYAGVVGDGTGSGQGEGGSVGVLGRAYGTEGVALGAYTQKSGPLEMSAYSSHGYVMSLDQSGNLVLRGAVTTHGSPAIVIGSNQGSRVAYAATSTTPAIEDTGEGRIAYGTGFVAIDPSFAATLDLRAGYSVLVTPEDDCRGLYVTNKTARGFYVRELMNGRSSVAFAYRIVGRPVLERGTRLPAFADTLKDLPELAQAPHGE